jgi:hypothetical protein
MKRPINISLNRKVRPLRFAFLVDPADRSQLLRAIQINTLLWGGRFNPLVPAYHRTPQSWAEKPFRVPSAKAILDGYLRAFDPDFVVDMTGRGISPEGYETEQYREKRILQPNDLLNIADPDNPIHYGADVLELYDHLYSKEFRFQRRHAPRVVLPETSDSTMELFVSACFGSFPTQEELGAFRRDYLEAFEAEVVPIDPTKFEEVIPSSVATPLRIGSAFLQHGPRGLGSDSATLYYLDASNGLDILDYWNLRAAGWSVLPVPKQWSPQLLQLATNFVKRNYVPYHHNPNMLHDTTLQKARSLADDEAMQFAKSLDLENRLALSVRTWYPRIWDDWARRKDFVIPAEIHSDDDNVEVQSSGDRITFSDKKPEFADRWGMHSNARWANVLVITHYGMDDLADVIPAGLPDIGRSIGSGVDNIRAGREGLVLLCRFADAQHQWKPLLSLSVFEAWARQHELQLSLSAAGKVAQQLIQQIDGIWGAWAFADIEILRLIDRMARGATISVNEMSSRLSNSTIGRRRGSGYLDYFVERKLLRLGAEIQCDHCHQRTWYALGALKEDLQCEKCLNAYPFPAGQPPVNPWRYKAAGALGIADYCQGAYCVLLAIRLLARTMHASTTMIPSFILKSKDKSELEADFGLFYRSNAWFDREPYLMFAECKMFERFEAKDVRRMRELGNRFPGAVLIFCTLNDKLSDTEKRLFRPLAKRGRKYIGGDKWLNPVLILTRTELFYDFQPEYAWREAGGKFADFMKRNPRLDTIPDLCDATQQLHLDMESYWKTREEWARKRQARLSKRLASKTQIE